MALERPEAGYQWTKVPVNGGIVVVITGECWCWWCHWTGKQGKGRNVAVRCVRHEHRECAWCAGGYKATCRYVLPVRVPARTTERGETVPERDELLELSRVQYPVLQMMDSAGGLVGRRIRLTKAWQALNARIDVEPVGREHVTEELVRDVQAIVFDLGRPELAARPGPQPKRIASEEQHEREIAHQRRVVNPPPGGYADR